MLQRIHFKHKKVLGVPQTCLKTNKSLCKHCLVCYIKIPKNHGILFSKIPGSGSEVNPGIPLEPVSLTAFFPFLMTDFDDNFRWQFWTMLAIFDNFDKFWQLRQFFDNFEKTVLETCDIWDTDYSSNNWEPEFLTIFGTWQSIVTLDSIRNSCEVF